MTEPNECFCPKCTHEMEKFVGLWVNFGAGPYRNLGWYCPYCHHTIDEGWERMNEEARRRTDVPK